MDRSWRTAFKAFLLLLFWLLLNIGQNQPLKSERSPRNNKQASISSFDWVMRSLNEGTHQRVAALDGVGAGVVEFGGGDFQREEIAVDAVTVTFWMEKKKENFHIKKRGPTNIFLFYDTPSMRMATPLWYHVTSGFGKPITWHVKRTGNVTWTRRSRGLIVNCGAIIVVLSLRRSSCLDASKCKFFFLLGETTTTD